MTPRFPLESPCSTSPWKARVTVSNPRWGGLAANLPYRLEGGGGSGGGHGGGGRGRRGWREGGGRGGGGALIGAEGGGGTGGGEQHGGGAGDCGAMEHAALCRAEVGRWATLSGFVSLEHAGVRGD